MWRLWSAGSFPKLFLYFLWRDALCWRLVLLQITCIFTNIQCIYVVGIWLFIIINICSGLKVSATVTIEDQKIRDADAEKLLQYHRIFFLHTVRKLNAVRKISQCRHDNTELIIFMCVFMQVCSVYLIWMSLVLFLSALWMDTWTWAAHTGETMSQKPTIQCFSISVLVNCTSFIKSYDDCIGWSEFSN